MAALKKLTGVDVLFKKRAGGKYDVLILDAEKYANKKGKPDDWVLLTLFNIPERDVAERGAVGA